MMKQLVSSMRGYEPSLRVHHNGQVADDGVERRMALEDRIDNVGKKQKAVRRKKKGDDDVDVSGQHCA